MICFPAINVTLFALVCWECRRKVLPGGPQLCATQRYCQTELASSSFPERELSKRSQSQNCSMAGTVRKGPALHQGGRHRQYWARTSYAPTGRCHSTAQPLAPTDFLMLGSNSARQLWGKEQMRVSSEMTFLSAARVECSVCTRHSE